MLRRKSLASCTAAGKRGVLAAMQCEEFRSSFQQRKTAECPATSFSEKGPAQEKKGEDSWGRCHWQSWPIATRLETSSPGETVRQGCNVVTAPSYVFQQTGVKPRRPGPCRMELALKKEEQPLLKWSVRAQQWQLSSWQPPSTSVPVREGIHKAKKPPWVVSMLS